MENNSNFVGLKEMANLLHIHTSTLRGWAKSGLVPHHRLGKKYFFDKEVVMKQSEVTYEDSKEIHQLCSEKNGICISNGYLFVKLGKHPMANKNGYAPLHRLVMQAKLGRPLHKNEIVHHRNGNSLDNTIDNLELMESLAKHNKEKKSLREDRK